MKRCVCVLSLLLQVFISSVAAQQDSSPLISGTLHNATVEAFVQELESKTAYRFFYDPAQADSLRITISYQNQPVQEVLRQAFQHTGFYFAIDQDRHVFLTKGTQIITALPADFLVKGSGEGQAPGPMIPEGPSSRRKAVTGSVLENKLFEVGTPSGTSGTATLNGYVRNAKTGEPIAGISILTENGAVGTSTDQYGYYSITLPKGRHTVSVQGIGMKDTRRQVLLRSDGKFDMDLEEQVVSLKEVIVSSRKLVNINRVALGVERIDIKSIKQVPTVFGEADVLRVVLTLPGVKTVGEAGTGFNVRGGSADQNLILFNDATIYNPSHFFGFFSAFNPDVIKDVELYKSSIPAKYGGRLSSVLDITSREGNKKNVTGTAGIGLITSRINIEGPISKEKTSFILGGRTTYANWLLKMLPEDFKNSKASFYDANFVVSHKVDERNNLYLTTYRSQDHFNLNSDTSYGYSNTNLSLKWKHTFTSKLSGVFITGYDRYDYAVSSDRNPTNAYSLAFDISQVNAKSDFTYHYNAKHTFDFGLSTIRYKLHPGTYAPLHDQSLVVRDVVNPEQAQESALYFSDRYTVNAKLSLHAGLRYSMFNVLGSDTVNIYANGQPKDENTIISKRAFKSGDLIKTYHGPEVRLAARYAFSSSLSLKLGYNSLRQYIHVLSNTTAISPTDIWKLSDPNIRPQYGDQVSLGVYKNLKANTLETSFEVYYKRIRDYLDYKSGAMLVLNHHIETDVISTRGKAYGAELMVKKQAGKLNGWISYTYSRILLKMDDPTVSTPINDGKYYPGNYDKPHDVTMVGNFRVNHRFSLSLNATYSTGRPITLPIGRYYYNGSQRALFSERNAYRIPDYFRTDFSMNIDGNHKLKQATHNSWTIGVYNITGRRNPYSVYFTTEGGVINGYRLSIFGSIIPFINYNIRF